MDDVEQLQKIDACFNNYLDRDCSDCIAYHKNSGGCCFGRRFDGSHAECINCRFADECHEEYEEYSRPKTSSRPVITRPVARPVIIQAPSRPAFTVQTPMKAQTSNDDLFIRFLKDSVWGAFIGISEAMVSFFKTNHWR